MSDTTVPVVVAADSTSCVPPTYAVPTPAHDDSPELSEIEQRYMQYFRQLANHLANPSTVISMTQEYRQRSWAHTREVTNTTQRYLLRPQVNTVTTSEHTSQGNANDIVQAHLKSVRDNHNNPEHAYPAFVALVELARNSPGMPRITNERLRGLIFRTNELVDISGDAFQWLATRYEQSLSR